FDPAKNSVPLDDLGEMERFVLHQLNQLVEKVRAAYDDYEFHSIYHMVNNFVVELSAFYHDVIKDRLYTLAPNDPKRRGAQTVMHAVLSAMTRLMAPVLSFTCEEIWGYMPEHQNGGDSVFLADLPQVSAAWHNPDLAKRWDDLLKIRGVVNKELEAARREKTIGAPLDARVELSASGQDYALLKNYESQLTDIFIVSEVSLSEGGGDVAAKVSACTYPKCPRCWVHSPDVPADQSALCPKCQSALAKN
ncbi:MAG: class I tRNA ligase family protein, partial [Candidatus Adiutrix sp.]|nr:class I tRNA ligase family protein [Candidatus Adiutrix sp.]